MKQNGLCGSKAAAPQVLTILAGLAVAFVSGCGMRPSQRHQIAMWEREAAELGHPEVKYVEHVDPTTAAGLGFLFGAGGFYVHRTGLGVTGLLFWPLSITWVPATAYSSAYEYNFREFRQEILTLREEAARKPHWTDPNASMRRLEELRTQGRITESEYRDARQKLLDQSDARPPEGR